MHSPSISHKKRQQLLMKAVEMHKANNLDAAAKIYEKVLASNPKDPDALNLLGLIYYRRHQYDEAFKLIKTAISYSPNDAAFHNNIGNIYFDTDQLDIALSHYNKSLSIDPKQADAASNIANILWKLHRYQEAEDTYDAAMKNQVKTTSYYHNMGHIYHAQKKYFEAEALHIKGLKLDPNDPQLHLDTGLLQLSLENFKEGWKNYSWGGKTTNNLRKFYSLPAPQWDGSPLKDKTILIYGEQGIGDEIMFAQFIPEISPLAKNCIVACTPRLTPIFSRSFPEIEFFSGYNDSSLKSIVQQKKVDYASPTGELAKYLRPNKTSFSKPRKYLKPCHKAVTKWEQRYATLGKGYKIGISWKGGVETRTSLSRTIELEQWLQLLKLPNCHFINLQYGDQSKEIDHLKNIHHIILHHWQDSLPLKNMDDFAAQTAALDLVISIDNSTVHLAAALGTPTWLLLPFSPDWRWGINRQGSFWYNCITLFHQRIQNNWTDVFSEVINRLSSIQSDKAYLPYLSFDQLPTALYLNDRSDQNSWGEVCSNRAISDMLNKRILKVHSIFSKEISLIKHPTNIIENIFGHQQLEKLCQTNTALTKLIKNAACLIINGESLLGNAHSDMLTLLSIAYISKTIYEKPVYIINLSTGSNLKNKLPALNPYYQQLFQTIDGVATQDTISSQLVQQMELYHHICFNCIPLFLETNFAVSSIKQTNTIIIAGINHLTNKTLSSLAEYISKITRNGFKIKIIVEAKETINQPSRAEQLLSSLLSESEANWDFIYIHDLSTWLNTIASAKLLITNHHSTLIPANFVKTPCITLEASIENNNLTKALKIQTPIDLSTASQVNTLIQNTLEITNNPLPFLPTKAHQSALIKLAKQNFEW